MQINGKKIIINLDDIGFSAPVNRAVKLCYDSGLAVGVSIMSVGESFKEACELLRETGREEAGVHLTLTGEFSPCCSDKKRVKTLVGDDGKFYKNYMHFMTPYFKGSLDISEISTEFDEQIRRVKVAGLNVTHLDSHEHIHMFPGVFGVTLDLAKKYGIKYIRIPEESMKSMGKDFSVKDMLRQIGLRMFTARKKKEIVKNGLVCNDRFLGHFHSGRIDDDILCYLLGRIDAGITELAIHPADADDEFIEKFPWYKNTRTELSMLLEGSWRKKAKMLGIEIITQA